MLNVAFENPRKIQTQAREPQSKKKVTKDKDADTSTYNYLVPDRIAGLEELHELEKLCPRRKWNFVSQLQYVALQDSNSECKVEIDVTFEVLLIHRYQALLI